MFISVAYLSAASSRSIWFSISHLQKQDELTYVSFLMHINDAFCVAKRGCHPTIFPAFINNSFKNVPLYLCYYAIFFQSDVKPVVP